MTLAGINLMGVLGLGFLTGYTGLFSFGHAGFMLICTLNLAVEATTSMGSSAPTEQDFDVVMEVFPRLQERIGQMAGTLEKLIF